MKLIGVSKVLFLAFYVLLAGFTCLISLFSSKFSLLILEIVRLSEAFLLLGQGMLFTLKFTSPLVLLTFELTLLRGELAGLGLTGLSLLILLGELLSLPFGLHQIVLAAF